MTEFSEFELSL